MQEHDFQTLAGLHHSHSSIRTPCSWSSSVDPEGEHGPCLGMALGWPALPRLLGEAACFLRTKFGTSRHAAVFSPTKETESP